MSDEQHDGREHKKGAKKQAEHHKASTIGIQQPAPTDARQFFLSVLSDVVQMTIGLSTTLADLL